MDDQAIGEAVEALRHELVGYVTRLLVRRDLAEEIVQAAALRALTAERRPAVADELRPWLFRIATNLALDERRRHRWTQEHLFRSREIAEGDAAFVASCASRRGDPELAAVAREHLAICFACTLGQLPEPQAAALLLREVHGLSLVEAAAALEARPAQVKSWLQAARAWMTRRYDGTCALVSKRGVCHQCVELDGFFGAGAGAPLRRRDLAARLAVLRDLRADRAGRWETWLLGVLRELEGP
jgi:RNA polymerase sigma-70 factor (ECF subfamily)